MSTQQIQRIKDARVDFPMLAKKIHGKPFTYLDSAATTHKPNSVIDTISTFYREQYGTVHRAVYSTAQEASGLYQSAREKVASFFNAFSSREIIFTRGTTDSLNILAFSLAQSYLKPGQTILITEMEHHSNIVPWQMISEQYSLKLAVCPVLDSGEIDMDAFEKILNSQSVAVVSFPHIANILGTCNPVEQIAALAHRHGALVVLDGAQSASHEPIDLQTLGCDFFACSGHKMVGPTGIGVLWGRLELLEKLAPSRGGGDMIDRVTFEKTTYNTTPVKFEPGTPIIAEAIGLGAALDYLTSLDLQAIKAWEHHLLEKLLSGLSQIKGLKLIGKAKMRGALATFTIEGVHPLDAATLLDLQGVAIRSGHLCGQPILRRFGCDSALRASLAFYNNEEDLDRFFAALKMVLKQLNP